MAPHHRGHMGMLVGDGLVPVHPTPSRDRRQRAGVPALRRYLPHHILACPRLAPHAKNPLGIEEFLERHHGIISEADKGTSPLETWPHLTLNPFLQHMVQEDVRETG